MNDTFSPLIAAVSAYRAENPGTSLDARAVRDRILDAAARRRTQRARRITWLLPIAAVLVGTGALAASAPARTRITHLISHIAVALSPVERLAPPPSHPAARRPPTKPPAVTLDPVPEIPRLSAPVAAAPALPAPASPLAAAPALPAPAAPLAAAPALPAPAAPLAATAAPINPTSGAAHSTARVDAKVPSATDRTSPAPAAAAPALSAAPDRPAVATFPAPVAIAIPTARPKALPSADSALAEDLAAYRVAHRFHFALADYARALKAWDGYLSRFPAGTFSPEARLNRAVCLARLGDSNEARDSLGAIARGTYGKDGRAQARKLLQALEPQKSR